MGFQTSCYVLRGAGGAHMVVKGLTFALSHNLQLRTDGDDYLFDTIDNNGNGDEEVWALEDKSKSCSYLRISNDVHRALFGKSETVNGETISQGASFEYCFSFADFLVSMEMQTQQSKG